FPELPGPRDTGFGFSGRVRTLERPDSLVLLLETLFDTRRAGQMPTRNAAITTTPVVKRQRARSVLVIASKNSCLPILRFRRLRLFPRSAARLLRRLCVESRNVTREWKPRCGLREIEAQ